jgi:hypothetical protein
MEEEDINDYDVTWNAFGYSPGTDNGALIQLSGQIDVNGNAEYNAYMSVNNGTQVLTGQAWMPSAYYRQLLPQAAYESDYVTNGTCAGVSSNQYFGALHDGTFNSLTYVYVTQGISSPFTWTHWSTGDTGGPVLYDQPYFAQGLGSNSRAGFEGYGF